MARWSRAAALINLPAGARVLDLGCAFGFGTRLLARKYETYGHDLDAGYVARARRTVPGASFTVGRADQVPYSDGYFDAVVLLDVLEHVPNDRAVIAEVARLLRPGGRLVLSVPNRGALEAMDSLNVYRRWFGADAPPPTDDPSWSASLHHRHYDFSGLSALLMPAFRVSNIDYRGAGIAESINLVLLVLFKRLLPMTRLYRALQYLYFGAYLLEDELVTGSWGYHLMLTAERFAGPTGDSRATPR